MRFFCHLTVCKEVEDYVNSIIKNHGCVHVNIMKVIVDVVNKLKSYPHESVVERSFGMHEHIP